MVEVEREDSRGTETMRAVADLLGVVVHGFGGAVVDADIEVSEDVVLVSTQKPGKIPQWLDPAVGGPPEPLFR